MVDSVEEFLQIKVNDVPVTVLNVLFGLFDCLVGAAVRPEAVATGEFQCLMKFPCLRSWGQRLALELVRGPVGLDGRLGWVYLRALRHRRISGFRLDGLAEACRFPLVALLGCGASVL